MKQILLVISTFFILILLVITVLFVVENVATKIILGIVSLELAVVVIVYLYDILCPKEGTVYYKRFDFIANHIRPDTYKIKIKREVFGYPFIRVCRVSKEVYDSLTFGDTYNCTTGRITKP